jgi:aminoglycoside phosphotransferase (APT) family kinase protein
MLLLVKNGTIYTFVNASRQYKLFRPRVKSVPLHSRSYRGASHLQRHDAAPVRRRDHHRLFPACLIHGDTHLGNLYEEADGTPGFFDMQVARAPWFTEVTYHLVGALDMADRPRHEGELLRHYLDALGEAGIAPPSFDEALDAYRREVAYGLFIFLINETRFQSEAINTAYTARFAAAALEHDTVRLLG